MSGSGPRSAAQRRPERRRGAGLRPHARGRGRGARRQDRLRRRRAAGRAHPFPSHPAPPPARRRRAARGARARGAAGRAALRAFRRLRRLRPAASRARGAARREGSASSSDTLARVARRQPASWLPPLTGPVVGLSPPRAPRREVRAQEGPRGGGVSRARRPVRRAARALRGAQRAGGRADRAARRDARPSSSIREQLPQIEVAVADNATALVLRVLSAPSAEDLARLAGLRRRARRAAVPAAAGARLGAASSAARGEPLRYRLPHFGLELEFAPTDFIQVNGAVNASAGGARGGAARAHPALARCSICTAAWATSRWRSRGARSARSGVEGEAALVARARANAARNGIGNAQFHRADLAAPPDAQSAWLRQRLHPRAARPAAQRRARGAGRRGAARARSGCCIFPAIREVWRAIWGCWCTSTALRSKRPASSTCFRTPRTSNRWRCCSGRRRGAQRGAQLTA